jgi:hypothetical protein
MEVWTKGGGSSGYILTIAAVYCIEATPLGIRCGSGFGTGSIEAAVDRTQWHHVAAVFANPKLALVSTNVQLVVDLHLFIDGHLRATRTGLMFPEDLLRGAALGNHPMLRSLGYSMPFNGSVYEPRITLGALSPSQFTCTPWPPVLGCVPIPSGLHFTWTTGSLESAESVTGPWTPVSGATSPHTADRGAPAKFFRLRLP